MDRGDVLRPRRVFALAGDRRGRRQGDWDEVWFLHDDGELKLSLTTGRVKTRNLRERPQCSLLILDLANPYRYLEVRGTAKLEPDDDYTFAQRIGAKYNADVKRFDEPGDSRVIVTIEPVNVSAPDLSGARSAAQRGR